MSLDDSFSTKSLRWIRRYPLLLLIIGHCFFSLGIWNAEVGFGEDTIPIKLALAHTSPLSLTPNTYNDLYTLILAFVAPDPMVASIVMRFLVSLLTAVSLYLVLSRFSDFLRIEAILFACFVWIASRLCAPIVQFTNVNGFSFSVMLLGIYFLFSKRRVAGFLGFTLFSVLAMTLRPEWIAPFLLILLFLLAEAAWNWFANDERFNKKVKIVGTLAAGLILLGAVPLFLPKIRPFAMKADNYLLLGLGQCYASFSKTEHPEQVFDPMTEYQGVLDRTFGNPKSMVDAIRNNPHEMMRYFKLNTLRNLRRIPEELLSTRSGSTAALIARPHSLLLYGVLLFGGWFAVARLLRREIGLGKEADRGGEAPASGYDLARKVVILLLLCSASSVAIVMLVGSPRYWISIVPILYLFLALCCDAIMRRVSSPRFDFAVIAAAFVLFCWPNFLSIKKQNLVVRAMRDIAPLVRPHPMIAALWAEPLVVYGFRGEAEGVSAWDGIKSNDIAAGRFDILILDRGFRASRTWAEQAPFFLQLEQEPERYGFVKFQVRDIGPRAVYYRSALVPNEIDSR
ncbi:hypothetical protein CfE428DRAFT_3079 [Chthoniobacter flavus Ellin428]|uniref:Glycosyltransferase RgtA/B/C/D-like domain-containing protein n=1 Tax=Chthoniobacter flavus Ellin428 TaxID=497964 RepID=B4D2F4_9BACT|nr:hypothetical protein [Chthoniobacter flavus]EDY19394.1 hypothetical protein CfE428DRAFT_3079 [Chthoniobacter flavus Ellin428]TCO90480.1 hypothetical protein EV701_110103 [Chthoniobacter flavus]